MYALLLLIIYFAFVSTGLRPALFHAIPRYFGEANSMSITGLQMAFSYLGATLMPPLLGLLAEFVGLGIYPIYLAFWGVFVFMMMQLLKRSLARV